MTASDRDAARGATERDFPCCEVVGEGSDPQKARLARYAEAVHGVFEAAAQPSRYAELIARAVVAVADAEQAELQAEVERLTFDLNNAGGWWRNANDRAESAEAALVSEREAHAGLRARLEALLPTEEYEDAGVLVQPSKIRAALAPMAAEEGGER